MSIEESIENVLTDKFQTAGEIQNQIPAYTFWKVKRQLVTMARDGKVEVETKRKLRNWYLTFSKREEGRSE